jgi:hypothetical protein
MIPLANFRGGFQQQVGPGHVARAVVLSLASAMRTANAEEK